MRTRAPAHPCNPCFSNEARAPNGRPTSSHHTTTEAPRCAPATPPVSSWRPRGLGPIRARFRLDAAESDDRATFDLLDGPREVSIAAVPRLPRRHTRRTTTTRRRRGAADPLRTRRARARPRPVAVPRRPLRRAKRHLRLICGLAIFCTRSARSPQH